MAKILEFKDRSAAVAPITVVCDWQEPDPREMLHDKVVDLDVMRLKKAGVRAWTEWSEGRVHEMPAMDIEKKEYRQFVALRLLAFDRVLKSAKRSSPREMQELSRWPEYHALLWSKAEVHLPPPLFIPGYHEQNMKRERQRRFWDGLQEGMDLRDWPEYQSLARAAGFLPGEDMPIIRVKRPYLPKPRQTASRRTKRGYHRLQVRWEAAYGPGRKLIIKALKRKRRGMIQFAAVTA